jgi:hypothetical protein
MASACRIAGLTVHARGDRMSGCDTGLLLATFPDSCPWPIDQVLDEDFLPEPGWEQP